MIILRIILISLVIYLIVRYVIKSLESKDPETPLDGPERNKNVNNKKVSKEIGEYVDYEEVED